jgi:hypothetical protein
VLPFLSVYAVLPSSVLFLLAFSALSKRFSRAALFNIIILGFCGFFATFAFVLMPNAQQLHLHELADGLQQVGAPRSGRGAGLGGGAAAAAGWGGHPPSCRKPPQQGAAFARAARSGCHVQPHR